ncbi:hypothetical protein [Vibrio vulnificus]|uniref:Uncharacterized protein n=1 Tax=Vibrio vulnificus TaxID=672 RepID=A0AAN1PVD8_VIBVL|nr:hypothetical protein [Vibrio vulnificus]AXX62976.1 hypothetical protein FORC53_4637 [Vibrio vulnificus]
MLQKGQQVKVSGKSLYLITFSHIRNSNGYEETYCGLSEKSPKDNPSEEDLTHHWIKGSPFDPDAQFIDIWTDPEHPSYIRLENGVWKIKHTKQSDNWLVAKPNLQEALFMLYNIRNNTLGYFYFHSTYQMLEIGNHFSTSQK